MLLMAASKRVFCASQLLLALLQQLVLLRQLRA